MRVGVYVDGYNLYYGARDQCGRGRAGWRWLDIRALITAVVTQQATWPGAAIEKIVYCTARIDASTNPSGQADQDIYLKALLASQSVDHIEYGNYVTNLKYTLLAAKDPVTRKPVAVSADWPVKIQDSAGTSIPDARFMVSYLHQEEKGSDVNVASHLLLDTLSGAVDAAVVVSNDSDLRFPVSHARSIVPVGIVKPSQHHPRRRLARDARRRSRTPLVATTHGTGVRCLPAHQPGWALQEARGLVDSLVKC